MQKNWILLLIGLMAGMVTCNSLQKRKPSAWVSHPPPAIPVLAIQQQWQKEEQRYQKEQQQLQQQVQQLNQVYQSISQKMVVVKKENQQLRQQVGNTIQVLQQPTDTAFYLQQCDSLQQQVSLLTAGYSRQDTLVQEQVNNLQTQLSLKDETIERLDARRETVNAWLQTSLLQNKQLEKEIVMVKKKTKRQRLIGTLKTIGFTVAAGWLGRRFGN